MPVTPPDTGTGTPSGSAGWYVLKNDKKQYKILQYAANSSDLQTITTGGNIGGYTYASGPWSDAGLAASWEAANVAGNAAGTVGSASPGILGTLASPLTGLTAIGDFFVRLTEANTWIRIGEVIIGILLIAVGVAKMSGAGSSLPLKAIL